MRDTDADWEMLAQSKPYFAVLTNEKFLPDRIDEQAKTEFFASGKAWIRFITETIRIHTRAQFAPKTAIDFGCGVGRLTFAMAEHVESVTGVDIAPSMIEEAKRNSVSLGVTNAKFEQLIDDCPPSDWVNTTIVLQHIPPERGYGIIQTLLSKVAPRGVISLHVTTFREGRLAPLPQETFCRVGSSELEPFFSRGAPAKGTMMMYDYDLGRVMSLFVANQMPNVWLHHTNHGGCHGFVIFAARP